MYKEKLIQIINNPFLKNDGDYEEVLIKLLYDVNKENTMNLFLRIQELDRKRIAVELLEWKIAAESTMNNFVGVSKKLLENKTSKQAKKYLDFIFDDDEVIVHLIHFCKIYFKDGTSKGSSNNGQWYFDKFKDSLLRTKEKWLPDGVNHNWVLKHEHEEYIKLILANHSKIGE